MLHKMTPFKKVKKLYFFIIDSIINFIYRPDVVYVVDDFNWSIRHDGENLCHSIKNEIKMRISTSHLAPPGTIIHFGDIYTFFTKRGVKKVNPSNPIILTWYHIVEDDIGFKYFDDYKNKISYLHLSNNLSREKLLHRGFPKEKIFFAPIPVDNSKFHRKKDTKEAKNKLDIPEDKIVIGSFQKDGNGWGAGLEPKLVKGPDIFCDIVEALSERIPIHILLSGPARGYVIKRLNAKNIPYTHFFFDDPNKVVNLYEALDLYLMTSRVEGGPKSLTESWAMQVPYAGTLVGMVADVGINNENFIRIDSTDIENSTETVYEFLTGDNDKKASITTKAFQDVKELTLKEVSKKYINLYQSLKK